MLRIPLDLATDTHTRPYRGRRETADDAKKLGAPIDRHLDDAKSRGRALESNPLDDPFDGHTG